MPGSFAFREGSRGENALFASFGDTANDPLNRSRNPPFRNSFASSISVIPARASSRGSRP